MTDTLPTAGEAAAIGAMSAAERAARERAEADYQGAIDNAIRAAAWRTDDELYVGLVEDILRYRGRRGSNAGWFSAAGAPDSDDRRWGTPGMAQRQGAQDGYGGAAYGAFGGSDAGFGSGSRLRPAVYGADDEPVRVQQAQIPFPLPLPPPPVGTPPRPGDPDYAGAWKELKILWGHLPDFDDLPEVEKPFFIQLLAAIANLLYNKPPHDAKDKEGAKAPGKPGEKNGFKDPKGGERWVKNPNAKHGGASHGWEDDKGRVWVPTGPRPSRAHGPPHWDVQLPKGKYVNVKPEEHINDKLREKGL